MLFTSFFALPALLSLATAAPSQLISRQSANWYDKCEARSTAPRDFKAFNLGGCQSQFTFTRERTITGVTWEFEATYPDGSRALFVPYRDFNNLAVSDYYYPRDGGNNWLTRSASSDPQRKLYTSVHELSNICQAGTGVAPTSWRLLARSDGGTCAAANTPVWASPAITTAAGTRPGNTTPSARRINDAGDYEISWTAVSGAAAYTVMFLVPTSSDEVGNPYMSVIGSRVNAPSASVVHQGVISFRNEGRSRKVAVNVVNSQGVWNLARDSPNVEAKW